MIIPSDPSTGMNVELLECKCGFKKMNMLEYVITRERIYMN